MKSKEKIVADIKKYGWHFIHVLENEIDEKYSYTIGLQQSFNHPEIAISGLSQDVCYQLFEFIVDELKNGKVYKENLKYSDILDGYDCVFKVVSREKYDDFFGQSQKFYEKKNYDVFQMFYPDKNGKFPWDVGYNLSVQEML